MVNEDPAQDAEVRKRAAEQEAERIARQITQDPELGEEWLRQDNVIYGGLMAIGIVFVQALLPYSLDTSAMTCVLAFAVAIPLLAALIMVNRQEQFRRRRSSSRTVAGARAIAQGAAFLGLVAGFWHLDWIAGVVVLGSLCRWCPRVPACARSDVPVWYPRRVFYSDNNYAGGEPERQRDEEKVVERGRRRLHAGQVDSVEASGRLVRMRLANSYLTSPMTPTRKPIQG